MVLEAYILELSNRRNTLLIEDGQLNFQQFKKIHKRLEWKKVPRELNQKVKDYFYIGTYEDENILVKVSIRPTKYMKVEETFKGRKLDGSVPNKIFKGQTCNWGSTVEVLIDDSVLDEIKKLAKTPKGDATQKVTWR